MVARNVLCAREMVSANAQGAKGLAGGLVGCLRTTVKSLGRKLILQTVYYLMACCTYRFIYLEMYSCFTESSHDLHVRLLVFDTIRPFFSILWHHIILSIPVSQRTL
jgi:hypothetical protein